jgi:hypothetical protein
MPVCVPSFLVLLSQLSVPLPLPLHFPLGVVVDPRTLSFKPFLLVYYIAFSANGPVNAVIYICHIYFTPPYHFTFKTLYLCLPPPPQAPVHHHSCLFVIARSASIRSAASHVSFRSRFKQLPARPSLPFPYIRALSFRIRRNLALEIHVFFCFPAPLPDRSILDPQDTLFPISPFRFV